jgi:hypothetical protein
MLKSVMRHSSTAGGGGGLPTTTRGHTSANNTGSGGAAMRRFWNKLPFMRSKKDDDDDGSAASIRLQTPVALQWQRSTTGMKISYITFVSCVIMMILGWRLLTYHASHVHVNCSSTECYFKLRIVGRKNFEFTIARSQFLGAKAVKTNYYGTVLVQDDVNLNEEWKTFEKGGRGKHQKNMNTYKGPDKNGNYLSYALYIRNKQPSEQKRPVQRIPPHSKFYRGNDTDADAAADTNTNTAVYDEAGEIVPERHISHRALVGSGSGGGGGGGGFAEAVVVVVSTSDSQAAAAPLPPATAAPPPLEYRILVRQYRIVQTRRRIRNQLQKIESYTKLRRQKLNFKENAPPDWRGILCMVFGFIGVLLSILLGVFWDEEHYEYGSNGSVQQYSGSSNKGHWGKGGGGGGNKGTSGPGARKKFPPPQALRPSEVYGGGDSKKRPKNATLDPYSRATPAQYEVSMQPKNVPGGRSSSSSRSIKKKPPTINNNAAAAAAAAPNGTTSSAATAAMATKAAASVATFSSSTQSSLTTRRRK